MGGRETGRGTDKEKEREIEREQSERQRERDRDRERERERARERERDRQTDYNFLEGVVGLVGSGRGGGCCGMAGVVGGVVMWGVFGRGVRGRGGFRVLY